MPATSRGAQTNDIIITEVLAANQSIAPLANYPDYFPDWAELYNTTTSPINLGDGTWSLSVKRHPSVADATDFFIFPAGTVIQPDSYLLVFFDNETNFPGLHTSFTATINTPNGPQQTRETFTLSRTGDQIRILTQKTNVITDIFFGPQLPDYSVGRVPDFSPDPGSFTLTLPTPCGGTIPCQTNTPISYMLAPAVSNEFSLKINEWLATNSDGGDKDWFEVYNPDTNIITLSGLVFVDRPSNLSVPSRSRPIPPLSYIGPLGFVQIFASDNNDTDAPADEVAFSISSSNGDDIYMYAADKATIIDRVRSSLLSPNNNGRFKDISEGRVPDGGDTIIQLPRLSPENSNFGDITNVVISEVLAHTDHPLEDAIEFYNPSAATVDISNFWLSNNRNNPKKFRIPAGTTIPPRGFKVFYEYQFNPDFTGNSPSFTFNSANGDEAWLFSGNNAGKLTGFRVGVTFGASKNGVSFGRYVGTDGKANFVAMNRLSFGSTVIAGDPEFYLDYFRSGPGGTNPGPRIGPLVINEIHYHPPDIISGTNLLDNSVDEFIEIYNVTNLTQPLFDDNVYRADRNYSAQETADGSTLTRGEVYADGHTNTWRVRGGVDFNFPTGISLDPGKFLLVVNFDPTNTPVLQFFTNKFNIRGVPTQVQIFGPYKGKLSNGGASVELLTPDAPQGPQHPDFRKVPYVEVDRIRYSDKAPWPIASEEDSSYPDGGGASLQRSSAYEYGNDPINWRAKTPTPGSFNNPFGVEAPSILQQPSGGSYSAGSTTTLRVRAVGGDLHYQWTFNEVPLASQTTSQLQLQNLGTNQSGAYQVIVTNIAGAMTSAVAQVTVTASKPDSVRPTVQITAPAAGLRTNQAAIVTGKASDAIGVYSVFYSYNGGSFIAATGSVTWSVWGTPVPVVFTPGTNVVRAFSVDQAGNYSLTNERSYFFSMRAPITLAVNGQGSISGAANNQLLELGRNFNLTAAPAPGYVLSNWVITTNMVLAAVRTSPTLSYLMASNLAVTANYVTNPFLRTPGKFSGLFYDPNDFRAGSSGFFTLTATDRGSYTASLLQDGRKLAASGSFDLDGRATNVIARPGTNSITVIWFLDLDGSDRIHGTASNGNWTAQLEGDRAVFNALTRPCPQAGKYTFAILGIPDATTNAPGGHSHGTLAIDANGVIKMTGALADKNKLKQTVPLSKNGEWPLYVAVAKGAILSWVAFSDRPTDDLHGLVNWSKPASPTAPYYKGGFNEDTMIVGSRFTPTNPIVNLGAAEAVFKGGNFGTVSHTNYFGLVPPGKTTNGGPHKLTLTFTPTTGLFKGSFTPTNSTKATAFTGVLLQKATNGLGFFLGTNQSGSVTLETAP